MEVTLLKKKWGISGSILFTILLLILLSLTPGKAHGEVKPITEARDKLEGISEEEEQVLQELFLISQEMDEMLRQEEKLTEELDKLNKEEQVLEEEGKEIQEEYDENLNLLEEVLVSYQRGGPASYLEILLSAEDFSSFLKRIHLIQDISRNIDDLLSSLDEAQLLLIETQERLQENIKFQVEKRDELNEAIRIHELLQADQEEKLDALKEEKELYSEYLDELEFMWDDLKNIFSSIVEDFGRIIRQGNFTIDDLNIEFSLFSVKGAIHQDTFNRIIDENSELPKLVFEFQDDNVILEVPERSLVLQGQFLQSGPTSMVYQVKSGTFYNLPLEKISIDELLKEGSLAIDFEEVAGDMLIVDIDLDSVTTKENYIEFVIKIFPF